MGLVVAIVAVVLVNMLCFSSTFAQGAERHQTSRSCISSEVTVTRTTFVGPSRRWLARSWNEGVVFPLT